MVYSGKTWKRSIIVQWEKVQNKRANSMWTANSLNTQYWPLGIARLFLFCFSRGDCFLDRESGREFCRPSLISSVKFCWENLWHGKVNHNISELSAESGVAVVNAYGSIIGDNEDHVDDSTTVCWYLRHHGGNIFSSVWNSKSWSDLFCLVISILIDPSYTFWDRTYSNSKGLVGVTFGV